jgi:outer membrane protein assembly factor BamB
VPSPRPRKGHLPRHLARTRSNVALVALLLIVLPGSPALAQTAGEPVWSQFQGGPGHPGALGDAPAPPYRQAWTFRAPEGALSGAVIVGSVAITVGERAVYGVDIGTGEPVWQLIRNGGPLSMPAVGTVGAEQVLVFLDESESLGTSMVGVDLSSMRERWRIPLGATASSGVTVDGANAYAADVDGTVYAVSLDAGTLLWTVDAVVLDPPTDPPTVEIGRVEGPLAAADGNVYVVARYPDEQRVRLFALDPQTGDPRWDPFSPRVGVATASVPAAGSGLIVIGAADRLIRGLGADAGSERWTSLALSLFSPLSGAALESGTMVIADASGGVYRLDPTNGHELWDQQLNELVVRSSPVLAGTSVLVGLNDGRLVALDVGTGHLVWQNGPTPGLIGTIALSPDAVVAVKGGSTPGLVAFVHDPDGSLTDVPSPTEVDLARLFGNFAVAFAGCFVALYVPFRLLRRRSSSLGDDGDGSGDGEADANTDDEAEDEDGA